MVILSAKKQRSSLMTITTSELRIVLRLTIFVYEKER
jgi:hypothetical protein